MSEHQGKEKLREIDERLLELTSLFEISKTLSSTLNLHAVLNTVLLTPMGRMMINKGVVLLVTDRNKYVIEALKGLPRELLNKEITIDVLPKQSFFIADLQKKGIAWIDFFAEYNLKVGFPVQSSDKTLGIIVFGGKLSGKEFTRKEIDFLESLSNLSATAIENSMMITELREVNRKLDRSNQELNTLFEIGSELSATFDVGRIIKQIGYALMGHLLVNKYAVFIKHHNRFELKGSQGYRDIRQCVENEEGILAFLNALESPFRVNNTGSKAITQILKRNMIKLVIPMKSQKETKGIICLGDKINRNQYSDEEIEFLVTLGNQAMISLENARLVEGMLEKQRIEEELSLAREIQNNLLPKHYPSVPGVELEAINISSQSVGGDYYDILEFDDATQGIVIADVSGKGVPASLLMANLQASFRALSEIVVNPARLIEKINNITYNNTASDRFITLFYCRFHREVFKMEYCNAGHNHPFILAKDGTVRYLDRGGLIIGMLPDLEYQKGTITLRHGDTLVMYTDGITEALNTSNEEFGENRLFELCKKYNQLPAKELSAAIVQAVKDYSGAVPQSDDSTLVVLKVT